MNCKNVLDLLRDNIVLMIICLYARSRRQLITSTHSRTHSKDTIDSCLDGEDYIQHSIPILIFLGAGLKAWALFPWIENTRILFSLLLKCWYRRDSWTEMVLMTLMVIREARAAGYAAHIRLRAL
jgi:hypothetical protein